MNEGDQKAIDADRQWREISAKCEEDPESDLLHYELEEAGREFSKAIAWREGWYAGKGIKEVPKLRSGDLK